MTAQDVVRSNSPLQALRSERDRFVALAFSWADILLELNAEGGIVYAAGAVEACFGRDAKALVGASLFDIVAPAERAGLRDVLASARRKERIDGAFVHVSGADGATHSLALAGYQLAELNGHYFIGLRHTASARRPGGFGRRNRDEQSGLYGSLDFVEMVAQEISGSTASEDACVSMIVLPGYENLQQRLVETTERQLLATLGTYLRHHSVGGDHAARLGPDQFGLMHEPGLDLGRVKRDIAGMTREADPLDKGVAVETATIEVDASEMQASEIARGLTYAIGRIETAKGHGPVLASLSSSLTSLAKEAFQAANGLQELISNAEFAMVLQPIIDARSGVVHHYEALARFPSDSSLGTPYEHIAFAEASGVIIDFDLAMARRAVTWLRKETPQHSRISVAVNVSGQSINSMSYLVNIDRLLKENPWVRNRLLFEITESSRIGDLPAANSFVQRLRQQGAKVCLDDFGAGAANFQYLSSFEVDIVKLDGQAVRNAQRARKGKAFLKALVGLCKELGVTTVAEMIETEEHLAFARECGVHFVQGYLFGEPAADIRVFAKSIPGHLFTGR